MKENSTTRQIKDYVAGAAFYVKKNLMGLTADPKANPAQNKQRPGSASQRGEDSTYGPFRAEMESEK